jgi:hypothetical protein
VLQLTLAITGFDELILNSSCFKMSQKIFGSLRESDRDKSTSVLRKATKGRRLYAYFVARPTSCLTPIHSVRSKILWLMSKLDSHILL